MRLPFPATDRIALVVRGKRARMHAPPDNGHADCILRSGAPIGFFVDTATEDGWWPGEALTALAGVPGGVYTLPTYANHRAHYVDRPLARTQNCISGVLVLQVTLSQAEAFQRAWTSLRARPGGFRIIGNNCSTHAGQAFAEAGLVGREISGLDTPDNLFHDLLRRHAGRVEDHYGYLGFESIGSSTDAMTLPCQATIDVVGYSPPPPREVAPGPGRRVAY